MPTLELTFASGESSLSVRRFAVHEALSTHFTASVWARSPDHSLDLEALVGKAASLKIESGYAHAGGGRVWSGVVAYLEQAAAEPSARGLSTYHLTIVPRLWLLTHRTNYRVYQHLKIPDILDKLLAEWEIKPEWRIERGKYPELEYKIQYEETDYDFVHRLLEEAGITLFFDDSGGEEAKMVLSDQPHKNKKREGAPLRYVDNPNHSSEKEFVTRVHLGHEVRPGAHVIRDVDFRRPSYVLAGEAPKAEGEEARYENYDYRPGSHRVEPGEAGDTPSADDRGIARHDEAFGHGRAGRALLGARMGNKAVSFDANVVDLRPGTVFSIDGHPHAAVDGKELLVTGFSLQGSPGGEWTMTGQAVFADVTYVPPEKTARPVAHGVQTATVVGPAGEEIHTDEFGRVRVQFPWDREGKNNEESSCWVRVNQGWGGRGYGIINIPRIGQEVLVGFLEGNPDEPAIMARVYNQTQPVQYKLNENKTVSSWKSNSSIQEDTGKPGFNEIKYEDKQGDELFYVQAQKNLRKLVKNDETITVLRDRDKTVGINETDTTLVNRTEVTGVNRTETTGENRTTFVVGNRAKLVKKDEDEVTEGHKQTLVVKDLDLVAQSRQREHVQQDSHLHVDGKRSERIDGTQSLTVVVDQFEEVTGSHALHASAEIHLAAVESLIAEGADVTFKGPGGFVRMNGAGVWIVGSMVEINVGGSAGDGKGSKPELPEDTEIARVKEPDEETDDDSGDEKAESA